MRSHASLEKYGWDADLERASLQIISETTRPARIAAVDRGSFLLFTEDGERRGVARAGLELATGDWVVVEAGGPDELAPILAALPRRTKLARKVAGKRTAEQTLVANVDLVFLVVALDRDFNARRIERYLSLAWAGGTQPVLIGTKSDRVDDVAPALDEARTVAVGVPVHFVSSVTGHGLNEIGTYVRTGKTIAVVGSSGSGKSTLINALCGRVVQAVNDLGWANKGRHTTTRRELIEVPGGGLLVDTPGLREVGLWDASEGLSVAFADIEEVAGLCRFRDCRHEGEPGCAVVNAIPEDRLESYRKLRREARNIEIRADKAAQAQRRREWRRVARSFKKDAY